MNIIDFKEKLISREIDIIEYTSKVIENTRKINDEYNYFTTLSEDLALTQAELISKKIKKDHVEAKKSFLLGVPISVKDCICVKDVESTAGSAILRGYKPLNNATSVEKIIAAGGIIIGKTSQDEFGFGSFSKNVGVGYKIPLNPFDKDRVCGGSSGGSAGITSKANFVHASLSESTGGSIVAPGAFCGVSAICPTYGTVSRNGLIDYGNSLDKIGTMAKTTLEAGYLLKHIIGNDPKDLTTIDKETELRLKKDINDSLGEYNLKKTRVAILKNSLGEGINPIIKKNTWQAIAKLEDNGVKYDEIELPTVTKYGISAYYILALSEASTNLAKYCGMRYGKEAESNNQNFDEYFTDIRSKWMGKEAKRRAMLGTFARRSGFRDAYYIKALKVRQKIIEEYKTVFKKYDAIISPTMPVLPPRFDDVNKLSAMENYAMDLLTVGPNTAGLPHLNVNIGFEKNLPIGMMITGDHFKEGNLIKLGRVFDPYN